MTASTNSGSAERVNLWVERGDRVAIQACRLAGGDRKVPLTIDLYEMAIPDGSGERISLESVAIDSPAEVAQLGRLGLDTTHESSTTRRPSSSTPTPSAPCSPATASPRAR